MEDKQQSQQSQMEVARIAFSDVKLPEFKKISGKPWISFGANDSYPNELLYLFNKSPKHGAIVGGKAHYIAGGGIKAESEDPAATAWKEFVNAYGETLDEIGERIALDMEIFNGFYLQFVYNLGGQLAHIYHKPFNKMRANKEETMFYFKNDWSDRREVMKEWPAFDGRTPQTCIFYFKAYRPGTDVYPLPDYVNAINYIEADVEVSKHTLTNAKRGWRPTKFINFYNGEPAPEKKKEITRKFKDKIEGSEGETFILGFNQGDVTKRPTVDDLGASDLTKEDYSHADDLISQNVYAGHKITSPQLFGIKTEGQLGGNTEMRAAYEIFKNTYVVPRQRLLERVINFIARLRGINIGFKFQPAPPIDFDFSENVILEVAPRSWILEKLGIDTTKYPDVPAAPGTTPAAQTQMANEAVRNLTGRQHQQLMRIIRQFTNGQLSELQARTLIKSSLGLGDAEIDSLLGVQSSQFTAEEAQAEEIAVAEMFGECGEGRDDFDILQTRKIEFINCTDATQSELTLREEFAAGAIAEKIQEITTITKKAPALLIRYSYEPRPGLEAVIPTTRPFCKKLVQLNRLYSRTDIERISERVGYSVWDRRGGFWGDKPFCRHVWRQHVVIKKQA